jgi:indolepyruvate ferredoxin oxidoreductase beta subunit
LIASELLEAARAIQAGFVTPDRTTLIASNHRVFTIEEKAAMGDGRLDAGRMRALAERFSRRLVIADFSSIAKDAAAPLNSVLLGAIAAAGALPLRADVLRDAIEQTGRSVDANLRGFDAGLKTSLAKRIPAQPGGAQFAAPPRVPDELPDCFSTFPLEAHDVLSEAVNRLVDYQDRAYADLYLARVRRFTSNPNVDGLFIRELARHLAVRMSVEDVIRVAQLKLRETRLTRVARETNARPSDIVDITEFMKPGSEEICGLLPQRLGTWTLRRIMRRNRGGRGGFALKIRTTRLSGFLRLRVLAGLRRWRRGMLRFREEDEWIMRWLELVESTLRIDPAAAREVVASATLVRGYGETYKRGRENWTRIMDSVVVPMLAGTLPRVDFSDAVLQARLAATKDPEGDMLTSTLAAITRHATDKIAAE